jgi:hypothetical protein
VYKYRTWNCSKHKDLLQKGVLYFAAPNSFEDTYDCNLPEKFPEGKDLYNLFLKVSKEQYPHKSEIEHITFASYWCKHSPIANQKERDNLLEYFRQSLSDTHGVLSLCKSANNELMWEKYGDNHKGYCVGFSLPILTAYCSGGGNVDYQENVPIIDYLNDSNEEKIRKQLLCKQKKYSFEDEYRLLKMNHGYSLNDKDRTLHFPNDCIKEIYLGKNMNSNDKSEIITIVTEKYPNAKIIER